ncbi:hypothetical protein Tco_0954659 [Tanacetum coccineum]|uniref:Uncharacterized protein n=1 Tax=Tanacetum coccineum TaxID=301880 RepID=A0ABQ5E526_9ASTR
MVISKDELSVGKSDARFGQWVEITMKKVQRKNLLIVFNFLKQEMSSWTSSKVTLDKLLSEQILGNIVHVLGGKPKRKDKLSLKDIVFVKAKDSPIRNKLEYVSDSESINDNKESLPPLPKLYGAELHETLKSVSKVFDLPKTSKVSDKPGKKNILPKSSVPEKKPVKKVEPTTKELLLTLMQ